MVVRFYDNVDDELIKFAVIISRSKGKWVFCKHKDRTTLEVPGGHREQGETPDEAAKRELIEETGAIDFTITPICVYSVVRTDKSEESYGMLYYAEINTFEPELHSEIESIHLFNDLPDNWTYPLIQPELIREAIRRKAFNNKK